jgi:hypothetical protein
MASASDDFSATNMDLSALVNNLAESFDSAIKLAKTIGEATGNGTLKSGSKLTLASGQQVGRDDLKSYAAKIKKSLLSIPRMVAAQKKQDKARRQEARAHRTQNPQPPYQFTADLVNFFKSADLGHGSNGVKTLQADSALKLFFESGVGNLTFGVSLFNVWGNIQKLRTGSTKVVLDARAKSALSSALAALKVRAQEKLRDAPSEEKRAAALKDVADLDADEIKNKDYMFILTHYHNKEAGDLTAYSKSVEEMRTITKALNVEYGSRIKASRPAKVPKSNVAAAPAPAAPAAPKHIALPAVATPLTKAAPAMPALAAPALPAPRRR